MPSSRGQRVARLGESLGDVLRHLGYQKRASALWAMTVWDQAVGMTVARHAQPERVDGSLLWVVVDSAAWAEELRWMEETLLARVNAACGRKVVTGLRMRVGHMPSATQGAAPPAVQPAVEERLRQDAEAIVPAMDPELRDAFTRLVARGLARLEGGTHAPAPAEDTQGDTSADGEGLQR